MLSPAESNVTMELKEIEPGLSAFACPKSGGNWIPLQNYLDWKQKQPEVPVAPVANYVSTLGDDSKRRAFVCPESGRLMIRYKVGRGLNFHVDVSPVTGGIWLDRGEWEALKSQGLHIELNHIFTASYQREVRNAEYEEKLTQAFAERIGPEDFAKVDAFKTWLMAHSKARDICVYLQHNLPEKSE
jgi:Zn-finger nucleic acid-binding protein